MRKWILVLYIFAFASTSYPRFSPRYGYFHIKHFAKNYNLRLSYSLYRDRVILFKPGLKIALRPGTDIVLINQKAIRLRRSVKKSKGSIFIPSQIANFLDSGYLENRYLRRTSFVATEPDRGRELSQNIERPDLLHQKNKGKGFVVILDAGHGGKDPGCISRRYGFYEKNITLPVTLLTKKHLLRCLGNNIRVVLTRASDVYLDLETRAKIANSHVSKYKKALFVSIHANYSMFNSASRGIETYYYSPKSNNNGGREAKIIKYRMKSIKRLLFNEEEESNFSNVSLHFDRKTGVLSRKFASFVQKSMVLKSGSPDRGIKRDRFFVLAYTIMPSILIELGFLSNKYEAKKLYTASHQNKLAKGIAKGIIRYIKSSS